MTESLRSDAAAAVVVVEKELDRSTLTTTLTAAGRVGCSNGGNSGGQPASLHAGGIPRLHVKLNSLRQIGGALRSAGYNSV